MHVDRLLESRGVPAEARATALATLTRTGLLDDRRFAEARARSLADRGAGDALIRRDLAGAGIDPSVVDGALAGVESEHERAARLVERRGASFKTGRYLAGKGFSDDVVHEVVARAREESLG